MEFMRSLRGDAPGSAKKPPTPATKTSSREQGTWNAGPKAPTPSRQGSGRTTTPTIPPEQAMAYVRDVQNRTPRTTSTGGSRRESTAGEGANGQDANSTQDNNSPRDSEEDGVIQLDDSTLEGAEGESVQVLVRIRPHNAKELQCGDDSTCLQLMGSRSVICQVPGREPRTFTFDNVLFGPQTEVFEVAGMPMVDNCMSGYNSSIFAYGQTGAGKTHTMLGQIDKSKPQTERGLAPRVFDYLFQKISEEEDAKGRDSLRYSCRCSFLEIYNETITDLLNPSATNLQIREDTHGCFVEYLTETEVLNVDDVLTLMRHGAENRHTGETRLNRESSRSHSVFTCTVEKTFKASNGVTSVICSRLNLIDLAGSERVHGGALGGSHAVGNHFKEAVHINKSLTTLGRVIMELVEAQRSGRLGRHIPYRDSRLTFLLQDSLGGNAKTQIIANVSPSNICSAETLSTLYFVQRAKCIRNKATINLDYRGDAKMLQNEILRLNTEISNLKSGITQPTLQENTDLRVKLDKEEKRTKEIELKLHALVAANNQFKRERERLEEKLTATQVKNQELTEQAESLKAKVNSASSSSKRTVEAERGHFESQLATLNSELEASKAMVSELQASKSAQSKEAKEAKAMLEARIAELEEQMGQARAAHEAEMQTLKERLASVEHARGSSSLEAAQLQEQLEEIEAAKEAAAEMVEDQRQHIGKLKQDLATLEQESNSSKAQLQSSLDTATQEKAQLQEVVERQGTEISTRAQEISQLQSDLESAHAHESELSSALQASKDEAASLQSELESARGREQSLNEVLQTSEGGAAQLTQELQAAKDESARIERELTQRVEAGEESAAHLRTDLEAANGREADLAHRLQSSQDEVAALQAQLSDACSEAAQTSERLRDSEGTVAELQGVREGLQAERARLQEELTGSQAEAAQLAEARTTLERELGASQSAVATLTEELQAAVAKLAREKGTLADDLAASQKEAARVHEELAGSQAEANRLNDERAALSEELGTTKGQLSAREEQLAALRNQLESAEAQINSLSQQVAQQQHEIEHKSSALETVETHLSEVRVQLSAREADISSLERTAQETDMQTHVASKEQQAQIATLQKEIIRSQEEYVAHEYELKNVAKGLEDQLDALRKDLANLHALLESKNNELAQLQQAHSTQGVALEEAKANIAARAKELKELQASTKEAMLKTQQLHETDQAMIKDLQKELNTIKLGRGDLEQQMKAFLVANTRQGRAFTEIRRLIEWATTPPSSARNSIGGRGERGTPMLGGADNGGGNSPSAESAASPQPKAMASPQPSRLANAPSSNEDGCEQYYREPHSEGGSCAEDDVHGSDTREVPAPVPYAGKHQPEVASDVSARSARDQAYAQ